MRGRALWNSGRALDAGRLIFERLSNVQRPEWAARILDLVVTTGQIRSQLVQQVLDTAGNRNMWKDGHRIFSLVRAETLKVDELGRGRRLTNDEEFWGDVLSLMELVAKVTYNAAQPRDPFDNDSGWWIAVSLRGFVDNVWRGGDFSKAAWSILSGERP